MWNKHPKALPYLFLSEMWERFGYYLMIGIFTLYLKNVEKGFATEKEASDLYGTFIALVFLTPFIGGLNTWGDRYIDRQTTGTTEGVFHTLKLSDKVTYRKDSVGVYDDQFRLQKVNGKVVKEVVPGLLQKC